MVAVGANESDYNDDADDVKWTMSCYSKSNLRLIILIWINTYTCTLDMNAAESACGAAK